MNMKICSKCKIKKDDGEFHKKSQASDGLFSYCKKCHREYQREHQKEYQIEYYKLQKNNDEYKERCKKYRENNKEKIRDYGKTEESKKYHREYQRKNNKTRKYKEKHKKYFSDYYKKPENRIKQLCRLRTSLMVKKGEIIILLCQICGELKVEAHHDNYNKPTNVMWLCVKHHKELHRKYE